MADSSFYQGSFYAEDNQKFQEENKDPDNILDNINTCDIEDQDDSDNFNDDQPDEAQGSDKPVNQPN